MRTYRIKPEFVDLYGDDVNDDTIFTGEQVIDFAADWEMTLAEIIRQLDPQQYTAKISVDNGHRFVSPAEAIATVGWDAIVAMMDDSLRETVASELAPCNEETFLERYLELSPVDLIVG